MKVNVLCTRIQKCTHLTLGPPPGLMYALMFSLWQWILERQHTQEVLHIAFTACNKSIRSEKDSRRYRTTTLPRDSLWKGLRLGEEGRKEKEERRERICLFNISHIHALVKWSQWNQSWTVLHGQKCCMAFYSLCPSYTVYLRSCPVCLVKFSVLFCLVHGNLLAGAFMESFCIKCSLSVERWQGKKQAVVRSYTLTLEQLSRWYSEKSDAFTWLAHSWLLHE